MKTKILLSVLISGLFLGFTLNLNAQSWGVQDSKVPSSSLDGFSLMRFAHVAGSEKFAVNQDWISTNQYYVARNIQQSLNENFQYRIRFELAQNDNVKVATAQIGYYPSVIGTGFVPLATFTPTGTTISFFQSPIIEPTALVNYFPSVIMSNANHKDARLIVGKYELIRKIKPVDGFGASTYGAHSGILEWWINLEWQTRTYATLYTIQYSQSAIFDPPLTTTINAPGNTASILNLGPGQWYFRIKAIDGAISESDWTNFQMNSDQTALPINLLSFTAQQANNNIVLNWLTASETNNEYFTLERSKDGISFEQIARIGGAGNSNSVLKYSYTDNTPFSGISYYRLSQTDYDGTTVYFKPVGVKFDASNLEISNLILSNGNLSVIALVNGGQVALNIYNINGQLIYSEKVVTDQGSHKFDVNLSNLAKGLFMVVINNNGLLVSKKINL